MNLPGILLLTLAFLAHAAWGAPTAAGAQAPRVTLDCQPNHGQVDRHCTLRVSAGGKTLFSRDEYDFDEIHVGDLDGDGAPEWVFISFNGGTDCCFKLWVLKPGKTRVLAVTFPLDEAATVTLKDLDGDHRPELITLDTSLWFIGQLCDACSPGIEVVMDFDGQGFHPRPDLMRKRHKPPPALSCSPMRLDRQGDLRLDDEHAGPVLEEAAHLIYTGEAKKAVALLQRGIAYQHAAVFMIFLRELADRIVHGPFKEDVLRLNHWYEDAPGGADAGPNAFYPAYQVASALFTLRAPESGNGTWRHPCPADR